MYIFFKVTLFLLLLAINGHAVSITEKEKQTILFYDQYAHKWSDHYKPNSKVSFWTNELKLFNELLPSGKILEIGVGSGLEAAELIKMGYEYTGIDPAMELIKIAQERFPYVQFLAKNVYELDFMQVLFEGFWCSAVLLHIPPENIDIALQKIKSAMKKGALGFISVAEGKGEYLDKETERWFYLYEEDNFVDILYKNGFFIEKKAIRKQDTPRKWLRSWLTFFVRVQN